MVIPDAGTWPRRRPPAPHREWRLIRIDFPFIPPEFRRWIEDRELERRRAVLDRAGRRPRRRRIRRDPGPTARRAG